VGGPTDGTSGAFSSGRGGAGRDGGPLEADAPPDCAELEDEDDNAPIRLFSGSGGEEASAEELSSTAGSAGAGGAGAGGAGEAELTFEGANGEADTDTTWVAGADETGGAEGGGGGGGGRAGSVFVAKGGRTSSAVGLLPAGRLTGSPSDVTVSGGGGGGNALTCFFGEIGGTTTTTTGSGATSSCSGSSANKSLTVYKVALMEFCATFERASALSMLTRISSAKLVTSTSEDAPALVSDAARSAAPFDVKCCDAATDAA